MNLTGRLTGCWTKSINYSLKTRYHYQFEEVLALLSRQFPTTNSAPVCGARPLSQETLPSDKHALPSVSDNFPEIEDFWATETHRLRIRNQNSEIWSGWRVCLGRQRSGQETGRRRSSGRQRWCRTGVAVWAVHVEHSGWRCRSGRQGSVWHLGWRLH